MTAIVDRIFDLFGRFGSGRYGEDLSIGDHMLQSAAHARAMGAAPAVVVAALLHDIGYFLQPDGDGGEHEALGAAWLSRGFGAEVTVPVALHVEAKRYLCAVEAGYHARLSEASRLSLVSQGGAMDEAESRAFERHPAFAAAVLLRRCDDLGKDVASPAPPLGGFRALIEATLKGAAA